MLSPEDAIDRRQLCELFRVDTSAMSGKAICEKAAAIVDKHDLKEFAVPTDSRKRLYSRKEAMNVWQKLQPLAA